MKHESASNLGYSWCLLDMICVFSWAVGNFPISSPQLLKRSIVIDCLMLCLKIIRQACFFNHTIVMNIISPEKKKVKNWDGDPTAKETENPWTNKHSYLIACKLIYIWSHTVRLCASVTYLYMEKQLNSDVLSGIRDAQNKKMIMLEKIPPPFILTCQNYTGRVLMISGSPCIFPLLVVSFWKHTLY